MTVTGKHQNGGNEARGASPASPPQDGGHSELGLFERFARATAQMTGHPSAFFAACLLVLVWLATGPIFNFSDTWQLVINTGTTIVTFLMVFLIQQSQNRDTLALQVKLSELIIAERKAHNALAIAEDLSAHELADLHAEYSRKASEALKHIESKHGKDVARAALKPIALTGHEMPPPTENREHP